MLNRRLLGGKINPFDWRRETPRLSLCGLPGRWPRPQRHPLLGVLNIRPDVDHGSRIVGLVDGDGVRQNVLFEFDDDKVLHGRLWQVLTLNLVSGARCTLPPSAVGALEGGGGSHVRFRSRAN